MDPQPKSHRHESIITSAILASAIYIAALNITNMKNRRTEPTRSHTRAITTPAIIATLIILSFMIWVDSNATSDLTKAGHNAGTAMGLILALANDFITNRASSLQPRTTLPP